MVADPDSAEFVRKAYSRMKRRYGVPRCPLTFQAPHELAIAVILSAQCTDEQVNKVTPALFARFPQPVDYYTAPPAELERMIYSTGFYKNKAKSIRGFCRSLVEEHGGKIPETITELVRMPGIGRKTANVILGELFGKVEGVTVDTHVARISRLWRLSRHSDAVKIERDLMARLPRRYWLHWSLYVIFLGRSHCSARRRMCSECYLADICPASESRPVR